MGALLVSVLIASTVGAELVSAPRGRDALGPYSYSAQAKPAAPQQPPPAPKQAAPAAEAPAPTSAQPKPTMPAPGEGYKYNPEGRRDPFLSLVNAGTGDQRGTQVRRPEGVAGMTVAEISVRGIMQSRGALIAVVAGPDNKTHLVHQGDKFFDGFVQSVQPDGLVIVQEVNDPLSLVKQRIVRKPLRSLEEVKQ